MADYEDLRTALRWLLLSQLSPMPRYMRGLLGNGQGKVAVPDRPGFCYVRPSRSTDDVIEVFNKEVSGGDGTPVLVGELPWQPGLTQIVSVDWETYIQVGWGDGYAGVALHGPTHEWRDGFVGTDAFNVHRRQIAPMRTYPVGSGSHSVNIAPYDYIYGGNPVSWCGLPGLDLSPAMPATGTARLMLTYLDMESNVAGIVTGSLDVHSDAVELSRPALPTGTWAPSAYVRLYGGQPGILERDISDARQLWAGMSAVPSGPAGGDLTGTYPNPTVRALQGYAVSPTAPTTGDYLYFTGSMWQPISVAGGGSPTGPSGGDLTGSYPSPLVVGIYGDSIDLSVSPTEGDVLVFSASGTNYWRAGDHGYLGGLSGDDHPQYLLANGTRSMSGELDAAQGIHVYGGQHLYLDVDRDSSIYSPTDDELVFNIAGTDVGYFEADGLNIQNRILKTIWFFPGLASDYVTGQYFNDNSASYPGGWTEDIAADVTNTNTLYGLWYFSAGSATGTSWQYSYDTSFDLENDGGANAWTAWLFGPVFWRDGGFSANLDYVFGVHGSTGGVMDANTYNRIRLHWDQATSVWQVRGETRAGAADSETATAYSTFTFPLSQPLWLVIVIRNNATKTCRNYIGTTPTSYTQSRLSSVNETTTWGNLHLVLSMSRGAAGVADVLYVGMWDSLDVA